MALFQLTDKGLYVPLGDFYIDPWRPVDRAVITHGHSDHARWGSKSYLSTDVGKDILRLRLGPDANIQGIAYGERIRMGDIDLSLHPTGHILGSCQVRIERAGQVNVISGDYKVFPDRTCAPFEVIKCHAFVTESTFGLPIYRFRQDDDIARDINAWWQDNRDHHRLSLLYGYALGKAQRLLSMLDTSIGPIYAHGAVEAINQVYRAQNIPLPDTRPLSDTPDKASLAKDGAIVLAPPNSINSNWIKGMQAKSQAFASGWMAVRGQKRRRALDCGFVVSDHADFPSLIATIDAVEAEQVFVTHGSSDILVQFLQEKGLDAVALSTMFGDNHEQEQDFSTSEQIS